MYQMETIKFGGDLSSISLIIQEDKNEGLKYWWCEIKMFYPSLGSCEKMNQYISSA